MLDEIKMLVFTLPAIIIGLSFHEFAHSYVAYKFGDDSQVENGRLTINPLKHIDPIGFIMIIFFHFGWAKPVVYDANNIEKKKLGRIVIALAGPFTNLVFGIVFALICGKLATNIEFIMKIQGKSIEHFVFYLVLYISIINFGLGIFNLLPIAPLDGSHIVSVLFKLSPEQEYKFQRVGMPILLILIFSDRITGIDLLPIGRVITYLFSLFSGINL